MNQFSDIGLVGLGVMGRSLALNMESKGFRVSVYNYIQSVTDEFMEGPGKGRCFQATDSYESLVASLAAPRKVFLMITAGSAVDSVIDSLLPLLSPGDVIIDGGNSDFNDTRRRTAFVESKGLLYVGTGVSGGEEGALKGPAMMPGGSTAAWPLVKDIFTRIAAKASDGSPCCDWMGPDGAGHYVKMVHNGIEYGDIELICECYQLMRDGLGMSNEEMYRVFSEWNTGDLDSYLISITADILTKKEPPAGDTLDLRSRYDRGSLRSRYDTAAGSAGRYVLDMILDTAGQKGTGKWTVQASLDEGVPLTLIAEAVFARFLSAQKDEREKASAVIPRPGSSVVIPRPEAESISLSLNDLRNALLASKIVSYAQGFALLRAASERYGWGLDCARIARIWRGGCIIRSVFLDTIHDAFLAEPDLKNLMLAPWFRDTLGRAQAGWRRVVCAAVSAGIPAPALSAALSYFDGYRCPRSGANLLQAQRDYFGAHTYERTDAPRGTFFHTDWLA
ncbi:MAG: NADP-dependent decarboxylating phosphogluconate dehydrogenase [Bacteroidales bacterium]|nr:NADP-dependent decarboxylating phosphogluconate dehydrogenase [Bacteroidales bacterium]